MYDVRCLRLRCSNKTFACYFCARLTAVAGRPDVCEMRICLIPKNRNVAKRSVSVMWGRGGDDSLILWLVFLLFVKTPRPIGTFNIL